MRQQKRRPEKHDDLLTRIREHVKEGKYLDTRHAFERKKERKIMLPEILYVLCHGRHERQKDVFKEDYRAWNYAIRGKTIDGRELRICITFDIHGMLVITAIDLDL